MYVHRYTRSYVCNVQDTFYGNILATMIWYNRDFCYILWEHFSHNDLV
jgi:hypothetical protein